MQKCSCDLLKTADSKALCPAAGVEATIAILAKLMRLRPRSVYTHV